jgi:hypothetical protein
MPDGTKPAEFVAWCQKHVTGDEKGDVHAALDTAVLTAYGFNAKKDLLAQLLALNQAVAAKIENAKSVTAPGVPKNYPDAKKLVTGDCIQP